MHGELTEVHWRSRRRKESWHNSPGRTENWRKFKDACKIAVKSHGRIESSQKLMECPMYARKVDGWSSGHRECRRKVPQQHRKLTEGPPEAWKVDWSWRKVHRPHRKLMEDPTDAQKVDWRSLSRTESWGTLLKPCGKLTVGHAAHGSCRRSTGCTES